MYIKCTTEYECGLLLIFLNTIRQNHELLPFEYEWHSSWFLFLLQKRRDYKMYRIMQIINNNCVVAKAIDKQQVVIMDRGIAFGKKRGDLIKEESTQKLFALKDPNIVSDLTTLLRNVPLDFVTISYELIDQVKEKYNYDLESYIYVTLTTHLFAAYQRSFDKKNEQNYLPDLSQDYPNVYQMADDLLAGFTKKLNISFPTLERNSVAFHFMNAHVNNVASKLPKKQVNIDIELVGIVQSKLERNGLYRTQQTQIDYDRLLVHLKYLLERLKQGTFVNADFSEKMLQDLKEEYPRAWNITQFLKLQFKNQLSFNLPNDEQAYLTIHIERLIKEKQNDSNY